MDRTTEAIAHFIGLFSVNVEEARQREQFDKFKAQEGDAPDLPILPSIDTAFAAPYDFKGYEPGLAYRAPAPDWVLYHAWSFVDFQPPEVPVFGANQIAYPGFLPPFMSFTYGGTGYQIVLPAVETLGSVANFLHQGIRLSDNDYFGVGGHGLFFSPQAVDDSQIIALAGAATGLSPFDDTDMPGSAAALKAFALDTMEALEAFQPEPSPGATVFVEKSPTLEGTFVNGQKVDEAPKLEDHFSLEERLEKEPHAHDPHPLNAMITEHGFDVVDVSVKVETGGNVLINNAILKNFWTASVVTAVVGDHIEINAIIQINAWCGTDAVTSAIEGWAKDPTDTQTFNIATFERHDTSGGGDGPAGGSFPKHWVIKEIDGDLMIVNWLQQLTFMMDNDIGILSSSGVTTSVYSGSNIAYNDVSIFELGFAYDLIIIGGSVFDLNIIHQLNILCDDDLIGAVAGFQTTGDGSFSTSGNLLWNQAHIYNIGGADRFDSLPEHYREAAARLADGDDFLNDGVLSDPAFAGYGALRVLYIKGDLINVQYVKQTNILSDSDQIALAMHATDAYPDAEWSVTTGDNALLNNAAILDLDSFGKTYVGGNQYSNDVLIQADIISTEPEYGGQNPDVLVNEAIAFLGDDTMAADEAEYGNTGNLDPDNAQADGLQTLVG